MFPLWLPILVLTNLENSSSIPEVESTPEENSREWQGYSVALHILLPVAGFCILWGRRELLSRLMLQLDRSCISVFCPSISQREKLLKWASENLPTTWSSPSRTLSGGISDLWKDGSLLCTLINMAIPGACSNPPKHWKKPPTHAQALAYKYFGIIPVFNEEDFSGSLNSSEERKFLSYLQEVQRAIRNYSSEESPRTLSSNYLTKGMGLQTGEQYRKNIFYVYSNTTNSNCHNVMVYIRGPFKTEGTATIPAFHNLDCSPLNFLQKDFRGNEKIAFKKEPRKSFLKSIALDFSSFVNLEKKTSSNDIPIHVEIEIDRAKVTYIPDNHGVYEISLITDGEVLSGSPFIVNVIKNSSDIREDFENTEQILHDLPSIRKKKIVSRFIDCINEKIEIKYPQKNSLMMRNFESIKPSESKRRKIEINSPHSTTTTQEGFSKNKGETEVIGVVGKLEEIHENPEEGTSVEETEIEEKHGENLIPTLSLTEATDEDSSSPETTDGAVSQNQKITFRKEIQSITKQTKTIVNGPVENPKIVGSFPKITSFRRNPKFSAISEKKNLSNRSNEIRNQISEKKTNLERNNHESTISSGSSNSSNESGNLNRTDVIKTVETKRLMYQNRPTSVVLPFIKSIENTSRENCNSHDEHEGKPPSDQQFSEENKLITIFNQKKNKIMLTKEKNVEENDDIEDIDEAVTKTEVLSEPEKNDSIMNNKTLDSLEYEIKEFEPEELLRSIRYNKNSIKNSYVDSLKAILMNQIHLKSDNSKEIKDFVNTTNKLADLNNKVSEPSIRQDQNNNHPISNTNYNTSPICSSHIAKEVETPSSTITKNYRKLSLVEKRKFLVKQPTCSSSPSNSSLSEKENAEVQGQLPDQKCSSSLKVLSVIETLKRSSTLCRSTSNSVPDVTKTHTNEQTLSSLSSETSSEDSQQSYFDRTRQYWKNLSLNNVSTSSSSEKFVWHSPSRRLPSQIQDRLKYKPDIYRSADDIFAISRRSFEKKKIPQYSSLNHKDFEMIELVSIDERKRKLLQDRYEKESLGGRCVKRSLYRTQKLQSIEGEKGDRDSVMEDNQQENSNIISGKIHRIESSQNTESSSGKTMLELKKPKATSQFKRAITFFKNLEKSSFEKNQTKSTRLFRNPELRRRFSLDFEKKKRARSRAGGSLQIPKTSDKFSMSQIYFDIMGSKRGSFKGAANKIALSETLSSLSTRGSKNKEDELDNNIDFDMFVAKLKTKKRRSIKSIFDVHY